MSGDELRKRVLDLCSEAEQDGPLMAAPSVPLHALKAAVRASDAALAAPGGDFHVAADAIDAAEDLPWPYRHDTAEWLRRHSPAPGGDTAPREDRDTLQQFIDAVVFVQPAEALRLLKAAFVSPGPAATRDGEAGDRD